MAKFQDVEAPFVTFAEAAAPGTPAAGMIRLYAGTDGLLYFKDDAGTVTAAGAGAAVESPLAFSRAGTLEVVTGALPWVAPFALTIVGVRAAVGTAPTGASLIVDVHLNGTTIFTTQGNRPTIAAAGTASGEETPDVTSVSEDDLITVDIDQIGSSVAGSDLSVVITYERA